MLFSSPGAEGDPPQELAAHLEAVPGSLSTDSSSAGRNHPPLVQGREGGCQPSGSPVRGQSFVSRTWNTDLRGTLIPTEARCPCGGLNIPVIQTPGLRGEQSGWAQKPLLLGTGEGSRRGRTAPCKKCQSVVFTFSVTFRNA